MVLNADTVDDGGNREYTRTSPPPVCVHRCQIELLHLPPPTLGQMVEAALNADVAASRDRGDGLTASIVACSKSQMTVVGSTT